MLFICNCFRVTLAVIAVLMFSGCTGIVPTVDGVVVSHKIDSFTQTETVSTNQIRIQKSFTDRSLAFVNMYYTKDTESTRDGIYSLEVMIRGTDWGHYESAAGEDGYRFSVRKIASEVKNYSYIATEETLSLPIPKRIFSKMLAGDYTVRFYGNLHYYEMTVPSKMANAVYDKVKEVYPDHTL